MDHAVFTSQKLQKRFANNGFVKLSIFSPDEVEQVLQKYQLFVSYHDSAGNRFHGTGWLENPEMRVEISQSVFPVFKKAADKIFKNYKIIGCGFLQKETGGDSDVKMHQDWTYVDESKFYSFNVWVALDDVSLKNGAMFVIPFSHKIFSGYLRPAPSYPIPFKNIINLLNYFQKPVELKRGECVCFNNALLHGSYPNLEASKRLALVATILPIDADLIHHYVEDTHNPERITEYNLGEESFLKIERGKAPKDFISKLKKTTVYPTTDSRFFLLHYVKNKISSIF